MLALARELGWGWREMLEMPEGELVNVYNNLSEAIEKERNELERIQRERTRRRRR